MTDSNTAPSFEGNCGSYSSHTDIKLHTKQGTSLRKIQTNRLVSCSLNILPHLYQRRRVRICRTLVNCF